MRRFRIPLVLALTVLFAAGLQSQGERAAWACSCLAKSDSQYFAEATHVFTASPISRSDSDAGYVWTFRVKSVEKGQVPSVQDVTVKRSSVEQCGFTFESGVTYQVYAFAGDDGLRTGLCSGTHRLTQAAPVYKPSGSQKPSAPPAQSSPAVRGGGSPSGPTPSSKATTAGERPISEPGEGPAFPVAAVATAAAVLALAGIVVWLTRRGRSI